MKYITHKEAISRISKALDVPEADVEHTVNRFFNVMRLKMKNFERVKIWGFGTFDLDAKGKRLKTRFLKVKKVIHDKKRFDYDHKRELRGTVKEWKK